MDGWAARKIFDAFLIDMEKRVGLPLAVFEDTIEQIPGGWVFRYQGREWVKSQDMSDLSGFLVGHGPVVVLDNGVVLQGGSLDRDPSDIIRRHFASLD